MSKYIMSLKDLELLNSFTGYGDFRKSDILFVGIEEGAGANEIEPGVAARVKYYGRNEKGEFENLVDGIDYKNGFWETSGESGEVKRTRYNKENGYTIPEKKAGNNKFPTLYIPARICLYLENEVDKDWFEKNISKEKKEQINDYPLFNPGRKFGISTALFDWKPLLRNTEETKIEKTPVYGKINEKAYHDAFEKFKANDELYVNLARRRFDILIDVIEKGKFKLIFIMGKKDFMVNIVNQICPKGTEQIQFDSYDRAPFGRTGKLSNGTKLVWTYHPSHKVPGGRYRYFKQVTEKCIEPIFK